MNTPMVKPAYRIAKPDYDALTQASLTDRDIRCLLQRLQLHPGIEVVINPEPNNQLMDVSILFNYARPLRALLDEDIRNENRLRREGDIDTELLEHQKGLLRNVVQAAKEQHDYLFINVCQSLIADINDMSNKVPA